MLRQEELVKIIATYHLSHIQSENGWDIHPNFVQKNSLYMEIVEANPYQFNMQILYCLMMQTLLATDHATKVSKAGYIIIVY